MFPFRFISLCAHMEVAHTRLVRGLSLAPAADVLLSFGKKRTKLSNRENLYQAVIQKSKKKKLKKEKKLPSPFPSAEEEARYIHKRPQVRSFSLSISIPVTAWVCVSSSCGGQTRGTGALYLESLPVARLHQSLRAARRWRSTRRLLSAVDHPPANK